MDNDLSKGIAVLKNDFKAYAGKCLFVRDHNTKQIVPFNFNNSQRIFHEVVEKQRKELGYVRILLDKARRFGGSTYVEGRAYWRTSMNFNFNTFIVAHEDDSTDTLFAMARLFHERNPLHPATKYSSKKELLFDTPSGTGLKSAYALACARDTSAGRSQGIHFLHGSEVAFWPGNPDELLDGLLSCISSPKDTEVYLESSGNGFGNRFQRDVFEVYSEGKYPYYEEGGVPYAWKKPGNDWVLVFIPFFAHEVYRKVFESEEARSAFTEKIEKKVFLKELGKWGDSPAAELRKKYNLPLEVVHWREWSVDNTFKGREEKFRQEFPATLEDSFLSQGSNVYPKDLCDLLEAGCQPPAFVGEVVERMGQSTLKPLASGHLKIWFHPGTEETDNYILTVDPGGGKKERQEKGKKEPDPTCVDVWHHGTGVQVAQWHGHIEYDLIDEVVELLGNYYRRGKACVEIMNHGYTVVAGLKKRGYPMYEAHSGEPGWSTNTKTKSMMVDGLYEMSRDGGLQIRCLETVAEMRTFVEKNRKFEGEVGCHDDRVMSAGMASQMMKLLAREVRTGGEGRKEGRKAGGFLNWMRGNGPKGKEGEYQEVFV